MRLVPFRAVAYLAVFALPAVAQPPIRMSTEMSHVELSAGAAVMEAGPGVGLEKRMIDLGLQSHAVPFDYPYSEPPNIIPGGFVQLNVGVTEHTMGGFLADVLETTTHGRTPEGLAVSATANIKTRALLLSFRPTPWIKVEAGPALMHRVLEFESTGIRLRSDAVGWVAGGDAKLVRRPLTPEHPPFFAYVTGQYRGAPPIEVPATGVPLYGSLRPQVVTWPAQHLRSSHWMIGVGLGFEI